MASALPKPWTISDRAHVDIDKGDYLPPRGQEVAAALAADPDITHVVVVHCETSSGIFNPIEEISEATYAAGSQAADRSHECLWRC